MFNYELLRIFAFMFVWFRVWLYVLLQGFAKLRIFVKRCLPYLSTCAWDSAHIFSDISVWKFLRVMRHSYIFLWFFLRYFVFTRVFYYFCLNSSWSFRVVVPRRIFIAVGKYKLIIFKFILKIICIISCVFHV